MWKRLENHRAFSENRQVFFWKAILNAVKSLICDAFFNIITENQEKLKDWTPSNEEDFSRLQLILDYIHAHYEEPLSLRDISLQIHLTRETCCRLFKKMTQKTIHQYLTDYRISQSIPLLLSGRYSVSQVSQLTGFSNSSRFARAFRERTGKNPKEYLNQNLFQNKEKCWQIPVPYYFFSYRYWLITQITLPDDKLLSRQEVL